jgi:hypothetical protein
MSRHNMLQTFLVLTIVTISTLLASPVLAQQTSGAGTERVAIAGHIDLRNVYMFRGVRQDDTGTITVPAADVSVRLHSADRGLTNLSVHVGTWNSLHSGWAGSDGPSGERWYESDVYTTVSLAFGERCNLDTTYTAYRSPNKMFTAVKELSVKVAADHAALWGAVLKPYGFVAFELHTKPGIGQLDGGFNAGKYLEVGAEPGYAGPRIAVAVPIKVGLSLGNYYELAGEDHSFGFASLGGVVTVPLGGATRVGSWNVHGGVEYQQLGTTTKAFNGGDASKTIASIGIGFAK